jgi:hypothetical protein
MLSFSLNQPVYVIAAVLYRNNMQRKVAVERLAILLLIRVTPRSKSENGKDYSG